MSRITPLDELFGEPKRPPESFARAVGPVELVQLSACIGPREVPSTVPAAPPPHRTLPRGLPHGGAARSAPPPRRAAGDSGAG